MFRLHDEYVQAYNEEYEKGNIGNGKNYDPKNKKSVFEFELYPKSHPVLKNRSFNLVCCKYQHLILSLYWYYTVPTASVLLTTINMDRSYIGLALNISSLLILLAGYMIHQNVISEQKLVDSQVTELIRILPLVTLGEQQTALIKMNKDLCLNKIKTTGIFKDTRGKTKKMLIETVERSGEDNEINKKINDYQRMRAIQAYFGVGRTSKGDWI